MTYSLVKVPRAALLSCLKCPLCHNLVHEATTISECLHTFCKDCIYQELDEEESDCCPVCNVNLGGSPLEKLRPDRQLDDVCAKIFPSKPRKRKLADVDVDHEAPTPAKRKERSLSSLGIGVPSSANPGFVKRKTKPVMRKSSIATSTDSESEDGKSDTAKSEAETEDHPQSRGLHDTGHSDAALSEDHKEPVKTEPGSDEDTDAKLVRKVEQFASSRKVTLSSGEQLKGQSSRIASKGRAKAGSIVASARHKARGGGLKEEHKDSDDYDPTDRRLPIAFSVVRERSGKGMKRGGSALAQLAEIAVDQSVKELELPPPKFVPRAPRGRGPLETSKNPVLAETLKPPSQEKAPHTVATPPSLPSCPSQLFKSFPPATVVKSMPSSLVKHDMTSTSLSKQEEKNTGFWFVLQAAESQIGVASLPQLSSRYLRIKDGKLPISVVKKYLMRKLHLNNENEVEIRCKGQLVVPNLPLESVRSIWFGSMPPSGLIKERGGCKGSEDYLMVLTYGRHRASV